jgi:hypothetical protein
MTEIHWQIQIKQLGGKWVAWCGASRSEAAIKEEWERMPGVRRRARLVKFVDGVQTIVARYTPPGITAINMLTPTERSRFEFIYGGGRNCKKTLTVRARMIESGCQQREGHMPFDIRTATAAQLVERATYLENFPASGRYRDDLHVEAKALRELAKGRA